MLCLEKTERDEIFPRVRRAFSDSLCIRGAGCRSDRPRIIVLPAASARGILRGARSVVEGGNALSIGKLERRLFSCHERSADRTFKERVVDTVLMLCIPERNAGRMFLPHCVLICRSQTLIFSRNMWTRSHVSLLSSLGASPVT